jgi:dihydrolipoamide dehydrogenase
MVMGEFTLETEVLVMGAGPGGYAAAFRAADLGLEVTMVDVSGVVGGVCLFRGCIPSKTLLHLAELINDAENAPKMGINFGKPDIDLKRLREWKQEVIDKLAAGLLKLAKSRGVELLKGRAVFEGPDIVRLQDAEISHVKFKHAILATGSAPIMLPGFKGDGADRIMTSKDALVMSEIPDDLLIVGGGYIGLELGMVYAALGSRITLVEMGKTLLPGVDSDLVRPLEKRCRSIFDKISFETRVTRMDETEKKVTVVLENADGKVHEQEFERAIVAIGRKPNSADLGLESAGVKTDAKGFVLVDQQQRTSNDKIFGVGDVAGGAMLAHKASREGKVAAEVIAEKPSAFDVRAIPAVVYTDPQIAWCGLTETEARRQNIKIEVQRFPWKYSGRALTMDATDGFTKILAEPKSGRILGVGIVGRAAEGLVAEGVLALEMGALLEDVALSMHPHPSLSETEAEAAEIFLGTATHMLPLKKNRNET